jgi:hypothetical protein
LFVSLLVDSNAGELIAASRVKRRLESL